MTKRKYIDVTVKVPAVVLETIITDLIMYEIEDEYGETATNAVLGAYNSKKRKAFIADTLAKNEAALIKGITTVLNETAEDILDGCGADDAYNFLPNATKEIRAAVKAVEAIDAKMAADEAAKRDAALLKGVVDSDLANGLAELLRKKGLKLVKV